MFLLPAAALCSVLVTMAAQPIQDQVSVTRRAGEEVSFSCGGTDQCGTYLRWYQKREKETFRLILFIDMSDGEVISGSNHPQEDDFTAVRHGTRSCELQINEVKLSHSATYYCQCLIRGGDHTLFGRGTALYVTDDSVVRPVVSVYPAVPTAQLQGRSTLLCLASGMSPPLVRFSWKRQKENGALEELPAARGGEQLELREPGRSAAVRIVRQEAAAYRYVCYVQHEAGTVEAQTAQEVPASEVPPSEVPASEVPASEVPASEVPAPEAPASEVPASEVPASEVPANTTATHPESQQTHEAQPDLTLQSECRVKLLCVLYSVLVMKSLVYCCGVSLLLILTGQQSSSRLTHAD
ncbi:Ig heavy chain Mem5-like [Genypterus blacodes]|uniref:Ig heavy chain Mem5-like n=1 Tax=Genypterus blacodes TaxID=154954 RepID=UPI003F758F56